MLNKLKERIQPWADNLPGRLVFGRAYSSALSLQSAYERGELDVERFRRVQLAALLRHALQTVPFYRTNYSIDPSRVTPDTAMDTLRRFDFLDKSTIMQNPEAFVSEAFNRKGLFFKTSGGSTGRGVAMYQSFREAAIERAFMEYPMIKLGYGMRSILVRANASALRPPTERPIRRCLWRVDMSGHHCNRHWMPLILDSLEQLRPDFLLGYPSIWEPVARAFEESGRRLPVRAILLESEQVHLEQIRLCERVFGQVIWWYGLSEKAALAYGRLDAQGNMNYQTVPVYSYAENTSPTNGAPEIVGTNLFVRSMPFIRYRTEDLGRIDVDGYISSLDGRTQETLITRTGDRVPGTAVTIEVFLWKYVESYQFVQNEPGRLDLNIVPRTDYTPEIERLLLENQQRRLGHLFDLRVVRVEQVARTCSGKRRLVLNNVGQKGVVR